jgi:phage/plasmid-associated DNA primase
MEYRRGSQDKDKRLNGKLRGMRMAYTGEAVGGNLDWTLLKTLSGGDTLIGGKLYRDDESFAPSHTIIITTNDRPALPPTAAFKGRLVFVPFEADFTSSKDSTLEDDLKREGPGILWKLIKAAPGVFVRGIEPPSFVLDATADFMDENDVARPFIEQCLIEDPTAVTPVSDIEGAVNKWVGALVLGDAASGRVMDGVKARWSYGRKRVIGHKHPVRGLLGARGWRSMEARRR